MLTPHCSAASGIVVPPSIVPTTRLRRSSEYGFAIHAGLLPADSLNHVRAAMGIPDSAFPGNALVAFAEQSDRLRRVDVVLANIGDDPYYEGRLAGLTEAMRGLGWIDGRNLKLVVHRVKP